MITLKEGQKVTDIHGNMYLIEKGDLVESISAEDVLSDVIEFMNWLEAYKEYVVIEGSNKLKKDFEMYYKLAKDAINHY